MYLYEYIFIFLSGLAIGIIARYILGYKKKRYYLVALNVLFGAIACVVCDFLGGVDYLQIFLSGAGGILGTLAYILIGLIMTVLGI